MFQAIKQCYEKGLYALACDDEASDHYNCSTTGIRHYLWRCRVFITALLP